MKDADFLNNIIFIKGDDADLTISEDSGPTEDHFVIEAGSNHIHLTGANVDFTVKILQLMN
jgi:hypothetical protein